ncbi:hypothetical protein Sango_1864500 [Sesamum angolense]|uniref:Rhamnogalacturonan lyase domain-containing protein n=1 Tax=Sesamum angolense TaxID=2727404 RepID=A0AAE1WIE2_9LAMI|nr:hypothetical protein Sango_1864500 [Sesamum angolense]
MVLLEEDLFPRCIPQSDEDSSPSLKLHVSRRHVEMDNGIVKLTLTKPTGMMTGVAYKGIKNLLEYRHKETRRGLQGTSFRVVARTEDQIEVSFTKTWNVSTGENDVPLNIDKRFIMLRGVSGFYSYAVLEHLHGWPDLNVDEARIAFKLRQNMFRYMAISDDRQRIMPTDHDRTVGHTLDYREAVLLTNPSNSKLKGEVDDKYQYSCDNKDNRVHGWICSHPHVGFWVITPSDEFRAGGPVKPDLTSHAGPTSLAIFFSDHYAGPAFGVRLRNGEPWKKVFGPVFVYLNSDSGDKPKTLWEDAKEQMSRETKKWPYDFPSSHDFLMPTNVDDAKGYQFWTRTDEMGGEIQIGDLVYDPPRTGPTLWEIGIPDRTAAEFYIPDPAPELTNKLYINHTEKFRQYGFVGQIYGPISRRRSDLHCWSAIIENTGSLPMLTEITMFLPHGKILFDVRNVIRAGQYTLRIALASASLAEIQVWINDPHTRRPLFTTRRIGRDNAIARHGIHGKYWLYRVGISGFQLVNGKNTIYLRQARGLNPFIGVMYDYIRLEGPAEQDY